jgi:hypothetical protein
MVQRAKTSAVQVQPPEPRPITQRKFDRGVISLVSPSNLPLNALVKADNYFLGEDGTPEFRPGVDWYGSNTPGGNAIGTVQNIITNPNFEAGTTNWNANSGATISQSSTYSRGGTYSLHANRSGGSAGANFILTGLTVGAEYTVFFSTMSPTNCIVFSSISGGDKAAGGGTSHVGLIWKDNTFTFTAGNATRTFSLGTNAFSDDLYIDHVAVGRGVDSYFDGGTTVTTTDAFTVAWDGTPNLSTSTKTVMDGLRYAIVGGGTFVTSDESPHIIIVTADGHIYRSVDDGITWDLCSGATFTGSYPVHSYQTGSVLYLYDGHEYSIRYTGGTTLSVYSLMYAPENPHATKTGLAGTTVTNYKYYISGVNAAGYTEMSTLNYSTNVNSIDSDRDRSSFDDSNYITLKWFKGFADVNQDGAINATDLSIISAAYHTGTYQFPVRYDLYVSINGATPYYFDSVDVSGLDELAEVTYVDKGQSPAFSAVTGPTENTTRGLRVGDMVGIATRLAATQDYDNPWRVWFSGEGTDIGKFSNAFGATYVDLQRGSQFRPVKIAEFHDGRGNAVTTLWRRGADGNGDIWQGTLDTFTVGTSSFVVPNFTRLPGSRGTTAPDSVVNVLNDYMYYNRQAFYNLGSRAQFLNLLSTDEASANIRPDVQAITDAASSKIAAFFSEARVYFSVPWNSDDNNRTIVYDTERKAWLPQAFSLGFSRFLQYTDTNNVVHLLAWKPGDSRLSEISKSIKGDYGQAFDTELLTGHVYVNVKNRFDFLWCEEGEIELSDLDGTLNVELLGMTRESGFGTIDQKPISISTTPVGWTTGKWTKHAWTASSRTAITNYSEATIKRYFNVQQDVNFYQYRLTTDTLAANHVLRTLQINGTNTDAGKPREWEILE